MNFPHLLGRDHLSHPSVDQQPHFEPTPSNIMESELTCPRTETVKELAQLLENLRVVHVRGTPASGKTFLATLLHNYHIQKQVKSVYIPHWPQRHGGEPTGLPFLVKKAQEAGFNYVTTNNILYLNIAYIIDEAQTSYEDDELWLCPIKLVNRTAHTTGPCFCLFIAYGSPSVGPDAFPPFGSPYSIVADEQRVSITISSLPDSPRISLFFNRDEFDDVLRRKRHVRGRPVALDSTAADYVFHLTNGHPGAVESILDMLQMAFRSDFVHKRITAVTKEQVLTLLDDEEKSFDYLRRTSSVGRSFVSRSHLTPSVVNALCEVLKNGSIRRNLEDEGIRQCYQMGWLHSEPLDYVCDEIVCVFPTRLHAKYVERYLTRSNVPFPILRFPTVSKLAEAVLRKFSPRNLSMDRRMGTGAVIRPVEARYQDEFYRALHDVLGFSSKIHSEWSGNGNGRIDFRITEVEWGIEILRDGDRLDAHCARFVNNGSYTGWIQRGWLKDWLIIDCRVSIPRRYHVPNPKLWRAVFADDYSSIEVLDASNDVIIPRFALMN